MPAIFVVCEHSSAQLGDRKLVRKHTVEGRGPGPSAKYWSSFWKCGMNGFVATTSDRICN